MSREFPTTAVLTLATGTLMGDFSEAHALIQFYAGGPVWTHQIPLLHQEIEVSARATLGDLYEPFDRASEGWEAYRDRMLDKIGPTMDVNAGKPFHREDAVVADAVEAMGGDTSRVTVVRP